MDKPEIKSTPSAKPAGEKATPAKPSATLRELFDELVLVFVLVMFLKTFLVEHYKIPTGSMTPTLLGGMVAYADFNGDGHKDLAYWNNLNEPPLVYTWKSGRFLYDENARVDTDNLRADGLIHEEFDHVLVSRLAYWFHPPKRGDIVVFKVPESIYKSDAPIFIKRCVGEPGDTLSFNRNNRLMANGQAVEQPPFFQTQHYLTTIDDSAQGMVQQTEMKVHQVDSGAWKIDKIFVPEDKAYVFGDNSTPHGSWDSRYWGGVPLDNFKGRAFVRVWPLAQIGFLH